MPASGLHGDVLSVEVWELEGCASAMAGLGPHFPDYDKYICTIYDPRPLLLYVESLERARFGSVFLMGMRKVSNAMSRLHRRLADLNAKTFRDHLQDLRFFNPQYSGSSTRI